MSLIQPYYIKQNFAQWEHYAGFDTAALNVDAALDNQIANSEDELAEYVTVNGLTITDSISRHLFNIVRYNLFMLQHADTQFDRDPQIVKAYNRSIDSLMQLRDGKRPATPGQPGEGQGKVQITAKRRRFDSWFRDLGGDITAEAKPENKPDDKKQTPNEINYFMSQTKPKQFVDYPEELKQQTPWTNFRAVVEEVYDGDTVDLIVSVGFDIYAYVSIRMEGVYATEISDPNGPAARDYLETLIPVGTPVVLDSDNLTQSFTRYIGTIYIAGDINVNQAMNEWIDDHGGPAGGGT